MCTDAMKQVRMNVDRPNYIMCPMCAYFIRHSISHSVCEPNVPCGSKMNAIPSRSILQKKSKEKSWEKLDQRVFVSCTAHCTCHMYVCICVMCVCVLRQTI